MDIKKLDTKNSNFQAEFDELLRRGDMDIDNASKIVGDILKDIKSNGAKAILEQIARFDKWNPKSIKDIKISKEECKAAYDALGSQLKDALHLAYDRIYAFHAKQKQKTWLDYEANGSMLGVKVTPMDRAGLYIPGGKAAYPSSLLMNAIPAIVAGVKEIVVCTPAIENEPNHLLLAALHLCGITEIYKVGGASAIGLLAYGIKDEIKKVDVVTGPGNIYVATAKKMVFGDVQIDMIAGPSEIGVIALESDTYKPNIHYIALDLLSQAEHDEMASSILITDSQNVISQVEKEIKNILPTLPRVEIASKSIYNRACLILAKDTQEALKLMNLIAPEHLEVLSKEPFSLLPYIRHAGAIFLGENTTEPLGDYLAGPNHTLPTGGSARFFSPLSTEIFMKKSSIIYLSQDAIKDIGEPCALLAHTEHLDAHRLAVEARIKSIKD